MQILFSNFNFICVPQHNKNGFTGAHIYPSPLNYICINGIICKIDETIKFTNNTSNPRFGFRRITLLIKSSFSVVLLIWTLPERTCSPHFCIKPIHRKNKKTSKIRDPELEIFHQQVHVELWITQENNKQVEREIGEYLRQTRKKGSIYSTSWFEPILTVVKKNRSRFYEKTLSYYRYIAKIRNEKKNEKAIKIDYWK